MKPNLYLVNVCLLAMITITGPILAKSPLTMHPGKHTQPVGFIENKGQVHDQLMQPNPGVKFLYCSPGFNVQLRNTGFSYDTYRETIQPGPAQADPRNGNSTRKAKVNRPQPVRYYHRVDVELVGSNPNPRMVASGKSDVFMNYITDVEAQTAISNVHDYQQVTYKDVYPHIDLQFKLKKSASSGPKTEYDFIVHPGGDAKQIQLKYNGANGIGIENEQLKIEVATGVFNEAIPHSYLKNSGEEITVLYRQTGDNTFSFAVPERKYTTDLVIDPAPTLLWCTYYGGSSQDAANSPNDGYLEDGIALDDTGNVYFTGFTFSSNHIATAGAYQTTYSGTQEPFLAKFNPTGTKLLWGTYIDGGTCSVIAAAPPTGTSVGCDALGNVYFAGITYNGQTVYLAKLSGAGTFGWSVNIGGDAAFGFGGPAIAVTPNGTVYLAAGNGVAYGGCYFAWYTQGFIAKYNSAGTQQWLHEVGPLTTTPADVYTSCNAIALDANSNIYITGYTSSATGIATTGAYQTTYNASYGDMGGSVFVQKYDSTGTQQWGTYYAGIASCCFGGVNNEGASIAVDTSGVYVTGVTCENTGVATNGAYKTTFSGTGGNNANIFVAKFSLTGGLIWGTYYGGMGSTGTDGSDQGAGIVTDGNGNVYVTGCTTSSTNIASGGALQGTLSGPTSAFLANFNAATGALTWGTYFHGSAHDTTWGTGIALSNSGKVYIVGETSATSGLATPGAYQTAYGGFHDVFVASFSVGGAIQQPLSATISAHAPACNGANTGSASVTASGGAPPYTYLWSPGGATKDTLSNLLAGTYKVTVTDSLHATFTDSVVISQPKPLALTVSNDTTVCSGQPVALTASASGGTPGYTYKWTPGTGLNDSTGAGVVAQVSNTITYTAQVTDTNFCPYASKTVTITVNHVPSTGFINGPVAVCTGASVQLSDTGGVTSIQWQSSADSLSFTNMPGDTLPANSIDSLTQTTWYRVTASNSCGASYSAVHKVLVYPLPVPVLTTTDSIFCSGDSAHVCTKSAYQSYLWNTTGTAQCTTASAAGGYWVTVTDANHCSAVSGHLQINVYPVPSVSIIHQGDTLSSFGAITYQWLKDNEPLTNDTSSFYVATGPGSYSVLVTDSNGCTATSQPVVISGLETITEESISIYPNPTTGNWQLKVDNGLVGSVLEIFDEQGRIVFESKISFLKSKIELTVPGGVYWLRISNDKTSIIKQLIKL